MTAKETCTFYSIVLISAFTLLGYAFFEGRIQPEKERKAEEEITHSFFPEPWEDLGGQGWFEVVSNQVEEGGERWVHIQTPGGSPRWSASFYLRPEWANWAAWSEISAGQIITLSEKGEGTLGERLVPQSIP